MGVQREEICRLGPFRLGVHCLLFMFYVVFRKLREKLKKKRQ